jgi:hypothetical protein
MIVNAENVVVVRWRLVAEIAIGAGRIVVGD